jgi:rRNA-processing protein FCF1
MAQYAVILDANFLLVPAQMHIDVYAELERQMPGPFEIILPDVAYGELEAKIHRIKVKHPQAQPALARELKLAREIADSRGLREVHVEHTPGQLIDDAILQLAETLKKEGSIPVIATNDIALRRKARLRKYPTAWVRAKKVVEVSLR